MTRDALKTLFHPFVAGALPAPEAGARLLFLGAEPGFALPDGFGGKLTLMQGFRPHFNALAKAGHTVAPEASGQGYGVSLVLAGRHRGQNELRVAEALQRTEAGGLIVVAGGKEDGTASLRKRVAGLLPVEDSVAKYHGVAFWLRRPADAGAAIEALRAENGPTIVEDRFSAAPGMFSHDRVDVGSRLLAAHIPTDLKGHVADFCAGWGYLGARLVDQCPKIKTLALYEADFASLEAARGNLDRAASDKGDPALRFFWHDLAAEPVSERYDAIVMNPPFHTGRAAEPGLGQTLIRVAARALRPGGRLLMVANRQLPYEAVLGEAFSRVARLGDEQGFKVFDAVR